MAVTPSPSPSVSVGSWYNPHKGAGAPASTLGNVGDTYFDTTNNVYYVKGTDGWQTTQGSTQSIPAAATGNKNYVLKSSGTAWIADQFLGSRFGTVNVASAGGVYLIPLCRSTNTSNNSFHFTTDVQFRQHGPYKSLKAHVEITVITGLVQPTQTGITLINTDRASGDSSSFVAGIYTGTSASEKLWYLGVNASAGAESVRYTMHESLYHNCYSGTADAPILLTTETLIEHYTSCVIPVSTAANQMLVSDGNGGWKVLAAGAVGTTLKMTSDGPAWST